MYNLLIMSQYSHRDNLVFSSLHLPIMSQYPHVSIQIIALCKSFPASFTNIWTMSSVYSLMSC